MHKVLLRQRTKGDDYCMALTGCTSSPVKGVSETLVEASSSGETPSLTSPTLGCTEPLYWTILFVLGVLLAFWGFLSPLPLNLILWALAAASFTAFLVLLIRGLRGLPAIEPLEVRRLVACQACGIEAEGPFQPGDYVFRPIGPCPRCGGQLYIKALYGIKASEPLKRQQPLDMSNLKSSTPSSSKN